MIAEYKEYLAILDSSIPAEVYEGVLSVLVICSVLIIGIKGVRNGYRTLAGLVLIEYLFVLFCSTLYFRSVSKVRTHQFRPFWSYELCFKDGGFYLVPEIGLNILVFIPVGLLLGMSFKCFTWRGVLLAGVSISAAIELMQLLFKKGLAEFDDLFNNTIGCMMGFGIYYLFAGMSKMIKTKMQ